MFLRLEELYLSLKKNAILYVISIISLFLITIVLSFTIFLMLQSFSKENIIVNSYHNKTIYTMRDTLYEDDDFQKFKSNYKNIDTISNFYNLAYENKNIEFLSVFDQPLDIEDFKGNKKFWENKEAISSEYNIKSLQMNEKVFDFNKLQISLGKGINWKEIKVLDKNIPVILGSDYKEFYKVGDQFNGKYYNRDVTFDVVGFLKDNQSIYYRENLEFYLDEYILVPYPYKCEKITYEDNSDNYLFKSTLYFAMINSDVSPIESDIDISKTLNNIASQSGFSNFALLGESPIHNQYLQIINIIKTQQKLLLPLILISFFFTIMIQANTIFILKRKRQNVNKLVYEIGFEYYDIEKYVYKIQYILSFILGIMFVWKFANLIFPFIVILLLLQHCMIYYICNWYIKRIGE